MYLSLDAYICISDTVNGVAFHPFLPMAATSSGHRRYGGVDESQENNSLSGI